ncbi:MAG: sigma-70 family RNA polymerase sigma factor [Actinobacteria bacterium]|nr:sigma-70 family RNA polymerase sigma factor [Actinomycetota bacterium]
MTTTTIKYSSAETTDSLPDLLQGISSGDPSAWEEIIRRYGRLVSTTVRSFRLQEADALDAIQTTWLRLAENAHRVQHPERLAGWLATTARRECLRSLHHAKTGPNLTDWALEAVSDPSAGPEQRAIDANITRILRDLIDELPPLRRDLIRMLFTDNHWSYAEIAHIAGIPLGGIGPTRARALRQLRDKIDEHGLGPLDGSAPALPGQRRTAGPAPAVNSTTLPFCPPEMSLASSSPT